MGSLYLRLQETLSVLPSGEKRVADFILENASDVISMTIEKMAAACKTSPATIIRLCKRLGVSGYRDFVRIMAADLTIAAPMTVEYQDIAPGDSVAEIAKKVCSTNMRAIENTLQMLDTAELQRAVQAIIAAPRVDFYGVGTSGLVALDAHNKFLRISKLSCATADPHLQILSTYSLKKGDVAVFISYSGETKDVIESAQIAKNAGATIITITRFCRNTVSELADIRLYSYNVESLIRSGPMSSRIAQLTIIDVLYSCVASTNFREVRTHLDNTRRLAIGKTRAALD